VITSSKWATLADRMKKLNIDERALIEKFIRSSGKGGQNVNKVSTCVYLKDEATGFEVKCQKTRSQTDNRYFARVLLCEKIENLIEGKRSAQQQKIEKIRRQKRKRSKRSKEKVLKEKAHRSEIKASRKKPTHSE
jgi:protein subunit release factor B